MFENEIIEFKREYSDSIKKTVVAFLNSNGGKIMIGIEDDGSIIGVDKPDELMKKLSSVLRDNIEPDASLYYNISSNILADGKIIIIIAVKKGENKPYYLSSSGLKPSGVYVRLGSTTVPAGIDQIRVLLNSTRCYEEEESENQDLSFDYLENKLRNNGYAFDDAKKRSLGIYNDKGMYTNLALLLSDQCEHSVKIGVFQGEDKRIFRAREEMTGSILKQIEDSFNYLNSKNDMMATFGGLLRVDTMDYDIDALREGIINALVHRDYAYSGSTIISMFINRIEIISLGGLPDDITREAMLMGVSSPRNKRLANILYRLKYIEAYGNGISKIISSYKDYGPKPEFIPSNGVFKLVLPNRNYEPSRVPGYVKEPVYVRNVTNNIPDNKESNINLDYQERMVLNLFDGNEYISKYDVVQLLNLKENRAYKILEGMLAKGVLASDFLGKKKIYFRNK